MIKRVFWLLLILTLTACSTPPPTPVTPTVPPTPRPTATPVQPTPRPNELIVCGTEPESASPFAPSAAGRDLLALFYELPAERVNFRWEPRLLEQIPSLAAGDAVSRTVSVNGGSQYVDLSGQLLTLPESAAPLKLPQLVVTFTLRADLRWSDGEPLTAEDVMLGYHLAQDSQATGAWHALAEHTSRLETINERVLRWEGLPGYLSTDFPGHLFPPQPVHRWRGQTLSQILQDRTPPGTGPFMIEAWERGREIRLLPNPNYSGPAPKLERIIFRFHRADALAQWPTFVANGECDIALPDPVMNSDWQAWSALASQGKATLWANVASTFLRMDFNLNRLDNRPNPLTDPTVRRALAHCIDRQYMVQALPGTAILVAESILPPQHPAYTTEGVTAVPYDISKGQTLLESRGWIDADGNGIREAHNVPGIADGTPLSLTLSLAPIYTVPAAHISAGLESCGVGIDPQPIDARVFYAADPASPLAGRTFDLALFGWESQIPAVCGGWLSDRIPNAENQWQRENFSGYTSPEYDAACHRALSNVDVAEQQRALQEVQAIFSQDLPTLPLLWRPYWFVARPEIQGLQPDISAPGALWNAETIRILR